MVKTHVITRRCVPDLVFFSDELTPVVCPNDKGLSETANLPSSHPLTKVPHCVALSAKCRERNFLDPATNDHRNVAKTSHTFRPHCCCIIKHAISCNFFMKTKNTAKALQNYTDAYRRTPIINNYTAPQGINLNQRDTEMRMRKGRRKD